MAAPARPPRRSLADLLQPTSEPETEDVAEAREAGSVSPSAPLAVVQDPTGPQEPAAQPDVKQTPTVEAEAHAPAAQQPPSRPQRHPAPVARRRSGAAPKVRQPASDRPRYAQMQRKEARLWDPEADELDLAAKRLDRIRQRKRGPGDPSERITANTLIRLGVMLILERLPELAGTTEEELWESLHPTSEAKDSASM